MHVQSRVFLVPKQENTREEYEDAAWPLSYNGASSRFLFRYAKELCELINPLAFESWIDDLRARTHLNNDDVALLRVHIVERTKR